MANRLWQWLVTSLRLFWEALRDFLPVLRALVRDILKRLHRWWQKRSLSDRESRRARGPCVPITDPAFKRPDPMIYSQTYLMKLGLAVTWDNPDIQLFKGGIPMPSSQLDPDSDYEIVARIWNNSTEAPVVNLPVRFSYLSFGVGTQSHAIGDTQVTLGVKGGSNHPAFASMKWHTPAAAGHYCIQVLLDWLDDANPLNNLGQENTNVVEVHSPAQFTFALHNPLREALRYRFEADAYMLPGRRPCREAEPREGKGTAKRLVPAAHDRSRYPPPSGWSVKIEPPEPELAAGAEQLVQVTVTAPDGFIGRQPININAFHRYGLAGGITVYVEGR